MGGIKAFLCLYIIKALTEMAISKNEDYNLHWLELLKLLLQRTWLGKLKGKNPLLIYIEHLHVYKAFIESHILEFFEARRWKHFHFREENSVSRLPGGQLTELENMTSHLNSKTDARTQLCSSVRVNYIRLFPSQEDLLLIPEFSMPGSTQSEANRELTVLFCATDLLSMWKWVWV